MKLNTPDDFDLAGHSISVLRKTDQAGPTSFVTVLAMPYSQRTQSVARGSKLQQVSLGCSQTALRSAGKLAACG